MTSPSDRAGAVLTIDLDAIASNYRALRDRLEPSRCAGVVKANAYGLGVERVAPALAQAGCGSFFVATLDEGIVLRRVAPRAEIAVFAGPLPGTEAEFADNRLTPVLNDLGQIERWAAFAGRHGELDAIVHVDSGMNRLGLPPYEIDRLASEPGRLGGLRLRLVMSHLACAEERDNPMNPAQLAVFNTHRAALPAAPASLANSSGIFLGGDYHFDIARPGVALYGVNPTPDEPNPMTEVVRLQGKIVQVRDVDSPQTVGYGASHRVSAPGRIATVPVGYADGYLRSFSNHGFAAVGDIRVPLVGRVSMDLITFDVTDLRPEQARPGTVVDLIGGACPIEELADRAGTIEYEILTGLGPRYLRQYRGG